MIPKRVLIIGGTHGNEWTGIQIVQKYADYLQKKFPALKLEFIFANPEAHRLNRRFVDEDLNRAFQFLEEDRKNSYEHKRAKEIKKQVLESPCLIIDLHTTTANMGRTIIVSHYEPSVLKVCSKLTAEFADCRVIGAPDPKRKYMASQSQHGLIIEVGPVANSVTHAAPLESTLQMLEVIFESLSHPHQMQPGELEVYEEARDIHYPVTESGEINGYIHSTIQGKDFSPLRGEFVAFKEYSGGEVRHQCDEVLYPIFINEAAYYPQQLAFTLCRKRVLKF